MTSDTNLTLNSWVNTRITGILSMPEGSAQRALLARLRRGVGKAPGELPELCEEFTYLGSYSEVV